MLKQIGGGLYDDRSALNTRSIMFMGSMIYLASTTDPDIVAFVRITIKQTIKANWAPCAWIP